MPDPSTPSHPPRRRLVLSLAVLSVLLVGLGAIGAHALTTTKKATAAHPPTLYDTAQVARVIAPLQAAEHQGDTAVARWLAIHPTADQAAFAAWAAAQVPPPPTGAAQKAELRVMHALPPRTPTGDAAAAWTEKHGFKDIWKLYLKQYGQLHSTAEAHHAKAVLKATLALGKTMQAQLKDHFARLSPYLTDPTLNAVNQGSTTRKFSYPSKHAVMSVAAATVLDRLEPLRAPEFDAMLHQILYSRLYARGHYPSDLAAGERLGRMIGLYELHTVR